MLYYDLVKSDTLSLLPHLLWPLNQSNLAPPPKTLHNSYSKIPKTLPSSFLWPHTLPVMTRAYLHDLLFSLNIFPSTWSWLTTLLTLRFLWTISFSLLVLVCRRLPNMYYQSRPFYHALCILMYVFTASWSSSLDFTQAQEIQHNQNVTSASGCAVLSIDTLISAGNSSVIGPSSLPQSVIKPWSPYHLYCQSIPSSYPLPYFWAS